MNKEYFDGYKVKVYKVEDKFTQTTPWRFKVIEPDGTSHRYSGVPNYCETAHSALMRGWYRAKWLSKGTYSNKYETVVTFS